MVKQIFKFSITVKRLIAEKHGQLCILCQQPASSFHHVFFGAKRVVGFNPKKHSVSDAWNGLPLCLVGHAQQHHYPDESCNGKSFKFNREFMEGIAQYEFNKI